MKVENGKLGSGKGRNVWFCKNPTIVPEVGGCFRTEASLGDWRKVGASAVSKGKKLVTDKFFALGADNGNRTRLLSLGS